MITIEKDTKAEEIIIHADPDDCGKGDNADSLKTGNSGKRIACAVIGYSKENFKV